VPKGATLGRAELFWSPHLADRLLSGFPEGRVDTVKQSKRRGELTLRSICLLSPEDLRFACVVYRENPGCRLYVLVAEGSETATALIDARLAVSDNPSTTPGPQKRYPLERRRVAREGTREVTLPHPP